MFGVLHFLTLVLAGLAIAMLAPAAIALGGSEPSDSISFVLVAGLTGFVAGAMFLALRGRRWRLDRLAAFVLILTIWIIPPFIAAIPIMAGAQIGYLPALFEAVSAYTTTGATVLPSLGSLPPALIFWRAELQWLGGLITLMSIVTVLAPSGVGGLTSRYVGLLGPTGEGGLFRSLSTARVVATIYTVTTVVCFGLLLIAGIPVFDAVSLALSTVSTGGLMPIDGEIGSYERPFAEFVIMLFMLVGATSIVWHRMISQGRWTMALSHRESYWVISVALLVGVGYAVALASSGAGDAESSGFTAFRDGLFTGVSLVTTTGFEPQAGALAALPMTILAAIAIVGAGTMSTAGGIKFFRVGGMFVQSTHELKRMVYPHSVRSTHFGTQPYDIDLMKAMWTGAIVALAVVGIAALLLALNHPSFEGGALAAISAFSNIGPIYSTEWAGSTEWPEFGQFDSLSSIVMIVTMIVGRVEAVALLGLVNLAYWRS